MALIEHLIHADDGVWDVGAHHGYVTLNAARRVRSASQVHAFEPSALNHPMLLRHLRWNELTDVRVHRVALSDYAGVARFGGTGTSKTFALGQGPDLVTVLSGAQLIAEGRAPTPTFVKVDVEGAEIGVIRGLVDVLPPTARLLIAMHSRQAVQECSALLAPRGFRLVGTIALHAAMSGSFGPDPDLLALGPACHGLSSTTMRLGRLVP